MIELMKLVVLIHFEARNFASYKNEMPQPIEYERTILQDIDIIRKQDSDKDILKLKNNK